MYTSLIKKNSNIDEDIGNFLNYIWNEAIGSLEELFCFKNETGDKSSKFSTFTIEQVIFWSPFYRKYLFNKTQTIFFLVGQS